MYFPYLTDAANDFREHYQNGHYPGLDNLKKLSIKNHLAVVADCILNHIFKKEYKIF